MPEETADQIGLTAEPSTPEETPIPEETQPDPTQVSRNVAQTIWEQRWAYMEELFHANAIGTHNARLKLGKITDNKEWSRCHHEMVAAFADSIYNLNAIVQGLVDEDVRKAASGIQVAKSPLITTP